MMDDVITKKLDDFFRPYPVKSYQKGQILVYGGDNPSGIFRLLNGHVRQYDISASGDEIVVNIYKAPTFFPINWAINQTPNNYFYETATAVSLRIAPVGATVKFLKANPDVVYYLWARLYSGVERILRRMTYLMKGSAQARTVLELLNVSQRFGTKYKSGSMITITESELAALSGLTRETISRELRKLQSRDIVIVNNNHVIIKDIAQLEAELKNGV